MYSCLGKRRIICGLLLPHKIWHYLIYPGFYGLVIGWVLLLGFMSPLRAEEQRMTPPDEQWIVYYSDQLPAKAFEPYDLIVFDRDAHPPIRNLRSKGKTLLGYVSLGEVERYRPDYAYLKAQGWLMEENPDWPGHYVVDIRNPEWGAYVIEQIIPGILQQGFHGIFVDTLDSIEAYEEQDPKRYGGMVKGAVRTIKAIRYHYPQMKIMINRGFNTMPHIAREVDYVLAEGTLAEYNFDTKTSKLFPDHIYEEYVEKMHALKHTAPHLQLLTLDYWDMNDKAGVAELYRRHECNGFLPYVTTIELDRIDPRP